MGVNLSIKGVSEELAERLRVRAQRNHRWLQGELMAIVERAASEVDLQAPWSGLAAARQRPDRGRGGSKTVEQIAAEHRVMYPEPFRDLPRSVDLIRADRDAR